MWFDGRRFGGGEGRILLKLKGVSYIQGYQEIGFFGIFNYYLDVFCICYCYQMVLFFKVQMESKVNDRGIIRGLVVCGDVDLIEENVLFSLLVYDDWQKF